MKGLIVSAIGLAAGSLLAEVPRQGVPTGCDPLAMSEAYWEIWNAREQAKIDADIEANRKADGEYFVDAPAGTDVLVEQLDHDFRFGAHIFNFNQLGKSAWNDAYKASYGRGGIFNQATVAFYWVNYEPTPGKLRANGQHEDIEDYWNSLTPEQAMLDPNWRRPAPGPVIDFLKAKGVAVHGHILVWGLAKPYWIYDWYCPEDEKRAFDALGIPRHRDFFDCRRKLGVEGTVGFAREWTAAWSRAYKTTTEEEIERLAPVFTANMRRLFRKRVFDVAAAFGDVVDSWDVVNESSRDWERYLRSRTGRGVWKSIYGLMPGDYPLLALLDAREAMSPSARLAINDYNVGPTFLDQVRDLEREGAKIDIVGCQMHIMNTNDCMRLAQGATDVKWVGTPQVIEERLNTMAETGKPLHVSEVTITSPGADARSRDIQAILTRNIYRKWFSHKALMGITWWNTVDGGGVYGEPVVSGLFTRDLRRKPAYLALDELINREWRTTCTVKVREDGTVAFRGFRGGYRLSWTCAHCGGRHSRDVWLTGAGISAKAAVPAPCRRPSCYEPARRYTVDGRPVTDADGELSLEKTYPGEVVEGRDGNRWAKIAVRVVAPEDGVYRLLRINDYFGRLFVNGADCGELNGPWGDLPSAFPVKLQKGENVIELRTRAGSGGRWRVGLFKEKSSPLKFE